MFLKESLAVQVIMDCKITPAVNFRTRLGFTTRLGFMTVLAAEEIILQHNVLSYRVDAYLPMYKLPIEVDEQGHNNRSIDYEIERQKTIEKRLGCKFIRINLAKENFIMFLLKLAKYKVTLLNQLKIQLKNVQ